MNSKRAILAIDCGEKVDLFREIIILTKLLDVAIRQNTNSCWEINRLKSVNEL